MSTDAPQNLPSSPSKPDYKASLNLPKTDFPMKADLVKNEPARLAKWKATDLYGRIQAARASDPPFVLHDGPPFANGDIHIGHVLNKTLKDVVLRYKSLSGHRAPYVPGWDCHGLPIEHKIHEEVGPKWREMDVAALRERCFNSAQEFVEKQREQFQRVGILGDWSRPYRTMAPEYEARELEVFARIVERGLVYQQLKPVNWSIENQTALAEADIDYKDVTDTTVFVEFPSANPGALKAKFGLRANARVNFLIWTTTPWTLPANLAIAAGPDVEYAFVQCDRDGHAVIDVVAVDLVEKVFGKAKVEGHRTLATAKGRDLEGLEYQHPFMGRGGRLVVADYVTTADGTGLVHTAPGHGDEDYQTGRKYGLDVYCPVLANGTYDSTVPSWLAGMNVWKANPIIVDKLRELGVLFLSESYLHSYPHDARSKRPTIYRATEQWFVSVDRPFAVDGDAPASIRARALAAIESDVRFVPEWGKARLKGMLASRPDWVLSRQRVWGLPIPVFFDDAGRVLLDAGVVRAIAKRFAEHGSNVWFERSPADLLAGVALPAGFDANTLRKGGDTFDVWFDSGNSWFAVVEGRHEQLGHPPVDLYLEGSDQHRGWFQSSMLPAIAVTGRPPYKALLTHGFVVKPDGTKVSKSDKEYVKALDGINRHGADLLRLYICSIDYSGDVPASPKLLTDFGDKYRKLRNTIRFLLSTIDDFDPTRDRVDAPAASLDRWMLDELATMRRDVAAAYDSYKFHIAFKLLHDFCTVQVSAVYGNAMKDRLYCERPNSPLRRRAQSVLYECAVAIIQLLSPMCVFTADEAWEHLKARPQDVDSVHLSRLPTLAAEPTPDAMLATLMKLRDGGLQQLDALKKSAGLNKAGEAEAAYALPDAATADALRAFGVDLEDLVGCGFHSVAVDPDVKEPTVTIVDRREAYAVCARSWKRRPDVGLDAEFPDLSARDADAVRAAR